MLMKLLALLAQLQNTQLVRDIETCVLTSSSVSAMWQCILSKLSATPMAPGSPDKAVAEAAKVMAAEANL